MKSDKIRGYSRTEGREKEGIKGRMREEKMKKDEE